MRPVLIALCLAAALAAIPAAQGRPSSPVLNCTVAHSYAGLGAQLLKIHRAYMRHQPSVRNPKIRGPLGRIYIGHCHQTRYVLASFSQAYNGVDFGETDQPEYFTAATGHGWHDHGNTGGEICGTAPTSLLLAWRIVTSCPK